MAVTRRRPANEDVAVETEVYEEPARPARTVARSNPAPQRSGGSLFSSIGQERKVAKYLDWQKKSGTKVVWFVHNDTQYEGKKHFVRSLNRRFWCSQRDDCALCAAGHVATWEMRFNIVDMNTDPSEVIYWDMSYTAAKTLKTLADGVDLDDPGTYWKVVYTRGEGTTFFPISARDLDRHNMMPLTEEEIEVLKETTIGGESVFRNTPESVQEAADNLRDSDLPQAKE